MRCKNCARKGAAWQHATRGGKVEMWCDACLRAWQMLVKGK